MEEWDLEPARDLDLSGMDRYRSPRRESGLIASGARLLWWLLLRTTFRTWNRLTVIGREHLPAQPPFVLVANHSSHLDEPLLTSVLRLKWRDRVFPIAARDVFFERYSLAAFTAMFINAIPVFRSAKGRRGLGEIRDRMLSEACILVLFPEGTRTRTGEMSQFKSGVGMLVAGTPVPIVPCHIQGAFEALPPKGWLPRPKRVTIRLGPAQTFEEVINKRAGWDECSARLEQAVRSLAKLVASEPCS